MTNAEILTQTLKDWVDPIIGKAVDKMMGGGGGMFGGLVGNLIDPTDLTATVTNQLGIPILNDAVTKIPDKLIPNFANSLMDGFIKKRKSAGPLAIPLLGVRLTPEAFTNLKDAFNSNLKEYGESEELQEETKSEVEKPSEPIKPREPIFTPAKKD